MLFDEHPLKSSHLLLQNNLTGLVTVLEWFEQFKVPQVPEDLWVKCQLVLTEGFTNAVRHAHEHLPETTPIEIEVKVFADRLEMRIWDLGQPFDMVSKLQMLSKTPPSPEDIGGRGLLWMHQLTDELSYIRLPDHRNCLIMVKYFNAAPTEDGADFPSDRSVESI